MDHNNVVKKESSLEVDTDDAMGIMNDIQQVKTEDISSESETSETSSDNHMDMVFDTACAFCDDGGRVLMCEGRCMRSFHPTIASGSQYFCESLGFANNSEYHAIDTFFCANCTYNMHQCFLCGEIGSSDLSPSADVFQCSYDTCGHFYHASCVSKHLYPYNTKSAQKLTSQIVSGKPFVCPTHKCCACGGWGNTQQFDLQLAVCRRCPVTFHRKCLPRSIRLATSGEARAWDNVLPNRIMIYCMRHKMIPALQTPKRDHLLLPAVDWKDEFMGTLVEKRSKPYGNLQFKSE